MSYVRPITRPISSYGTLAAMTLTPRLSLQVAMMVEFMLGSPSREWYGREVQRETGVRPGTLYPALRRLENLGWLTSRWEEIGPDAGRPRRRLYRLTGEGELAARTYLARAERRFHGAAWNPRPGGATA